MHLPARNGLNSFGSKCLLGAVFAASTSCFGAHAPNPPLPAPLSAEADVPSRVPCELAVRRGAAAGKHIYRESEVDEKAVIVLVNQRGPKYPLDEKSQGVAARVLTEVVVDSLGTADAATFRPLEPAPTSFLVSIREFLPTATFTPARVGGHPVAQCLKSTFQFVPTYYHRAGGH
jgi:hypothetical protein